MLKNDTSALSRWRTARRVTLGAIAIAGTMSTAAAVANRVAEHPCGAQAHAYAEYQSFSGVGVVITQDGDQVVVSHVLAGAPADGKLHPGAILLSVDGERPVHLNEWATMIRGEQGTTVEFEVAYPCSGRDTVVIERDIVHVTDRQLNASLRRNGR